MAGRFNAAAEIAAACKSLGCPGNKVDLLQIRTDRTVTLVTVVTYKRLGQR